MYMALSPGALGIGNIALPEAIQLAKNTGYAGLEFNVHEAADILEKHGAESLRLLFSQHNIIPSAFGLPSDWRSSEETWKKDIDDLPRLANAARELGCKRTMTWILPASDTKSLDVNRRFHVERFTPIAHILLEYGISLGLEFIGPQTMRDGHKYEFIWRMEDMLAMGREIGPNVGLLLDCWHWHTSGATIADLEKLKPTDVVYVHVSDAPEGVAMDAYQDGRRCLPGATGVIDLPGFLSALDKIGYDGPVTPEPFGNPAVWAGDGLRMGFLKAGVISKG